MHRAIFPIVGFGLLALAGMSAHAQSSSTNSGATGNPVHGKALFAANGCGQCHGDQGQGQGNAGPQVAATSLPLTAFSQQLRSPRDRMPPYAEAAVSDGDVRDIYAYLQTLPKAKEVTTGQAQNAPAAGPTGAAAHGRALFVTVGCYQCHGFEGQGGGIFGPRVAPGPIPFAAFSRQLRNPSDRMPMLVKMPVYTKAVLPDSDVRDIYAFLRAVPQAKAAADIPLLNK